MTIVYGQIESLKRIKNTLNQKGISRFSSIGDINEFRKNYEYEKKQINDQIENDLKIEIDNLQKERINFQNILDKTKNENINKLKNRISKLDRKLDIHKSKITKYKIFQLLKFLLIRTLEFIKNYLEKNFDKIIQIRTYKAESRVNGIAKKINYCVYNTEKIITERSLPKLKKLAYTMEVVEGLDTLIAGAIGENLVERELKKLSDKYILMNDFSVKFNKPIYNRKEKDRIFSIQIDHLLISNSGIFILETKNWSRNSVENISLRSPIEQILRTEYALFIILNKGSRQNGINLNKHHWGDKQVPIRNIIVMINNKPKEKFKYVQVKTLHELNSYIEFFDPVLDDSEVIRIYEYLKMIKN